MNTKRFENKKVCIKWIDEKGKLFTAIGLLERPNEEVITVTNETDYNRILEKNVRKIYLK